jgi:hypothetical protein
MNENSGDFFPLERVEILYSMIFFLLKGILSEKSRLLHQMPRCNICMHDILVAVVY